MSVREDRPRSLQQVFMEAVELPSDHRAAFVREQCGANEAMIAEVMALLEHDLDDSDHFLEPPVPGLTAQPTLSEGMVLAGRYRLKELLGEGGMGAVYLAEQDHPRREVALKVVRWAAASPSLLRRFEIEAEALGRLQHPGIAQIYDAGNAADESAPLPYFAMEYVRGQRLLDHARARGLNTQERLGVMIAVCDAVQHAHGRGIIHRDLKPANILVDDSGRPKVLDFGVARIADPDLRTQTIQTSRGQLVGTLPYMSPEQIEGDPAAIDTRTDVYSLGVILYQLLADRLPLSLEDRSIADAARIIRDEEPSTLSQWKPEYRGDLAIIAAKALEKRKEDRYQSPAELAGDLRRFLEDEPIIARRPTTIYQLRKFARRNRALVIGAGIVLFALMLGFVGTSVGMINAQHQRDEAILQARIAEAVNDFLNEDLLGQANPEAQPDREIQLSEVVDRAAARLEGRFTDEPLVEASIRQTLGITYFGLGRYADAEAALRPAVELLTKHRGPTDQQTLAIRSSLATSVGKGGDAAAEAAMQREIHELRRRTLGPDHPDTLTSLYNLAGAVRRLGDLKQAEGLYERILDRQRQTLGPFHDATARTTISLAAVYSDQERFEEARRLLVDLVDQLRDSPGTEHPRTLQAMYALAFTYSREKVQTLAEGQYREVYEIRRRILGDQHEDTLVALNGLATALQNQGRLDEAEPLFKKAMETNAAIYGGDHPNTIVMMSNYAALLNRQDRAAEAVVYLREAVGLAGSAFPEGHFRTGFFEANLGNTLSDLGSFDEAAVHLQRSVAIFQSNFEARDPRVQAALGFTEANVGDRLAQAGEFGQAETHLLRSFEILRASLGENHARARKVIESIAALYKAWGRPEDEADWRGRLHADGASESEQPELS